MKKKFDKEGTLLNDPFKSMYDDVTDPKRIEANKRATNIKNMKEQKIKDTGL